MRVAHSHCRGASLVGVVALTARGSRSDAHGACRVEIGVLRVADHAFGGFKGRVAVWLGTQLRQM